MDKFIVFAGYMSLLYILFIYVLEFITDEDFEKKYKKNYITIILPYVAIVFATLFLFMTLNSLIGLLA